MATSGSVDFNLTARQLVTFALRKIRILAAGETPSAEDAATALEELNLLMKTLQLQAPSLWRQTGGTVALVANTASYVLTPRPMRVVEARYRDANARDLPMTELLRQQYLDLPLKGATGTPTQYFVDSQRATVTMSVWPVPASVTTETINYTFQRVFDDLDTLDNDLDIPQEHLETVGYQLADRLLDTYGKDEPRITQRAAHLMQMAQDADREAFVQMVPERRR